MKLEEFKLFIDVRDSLKNNKDEYIFYKTDHHWTMRGAAYAYRALAEELDMMGQDPFEYNIEISKLKFLGSIYSQAPSFGFEGEMFETPLLYWDQEKELVYSDTTIVITRESSVISGKGFKSNPNMTKYEIMHPTGYFPIEE